MVAAPLLLVVCLGASFAITEATDLFADGNFVRLTNVASGRNLHTSPDASEDRVFHGMEFGGAWQVELLQRSPLRVRLQNLRWLTWLHVKSGSKASGDPVYQDAGPDYSEGSAWLVDYIDYRTVTLRSDRSGLYLYGRAANGRQSQPAYQFPRADRGSHWTVAVFRGASTVTSPLSQAVNDAEVEVRCPSGKWVQDCVSTFLGDGLKVSTDGRTCTARSSGTAIQARALCGQAVSTVTYSGNYREGDISIVCPDSSNPLVCTCITLWGADRICGGSTSFAPEGGRCKKSVPPGSVSHRRRNQGRVGATIYAVCGEAPMDPVQPSSPGTAPTPSSPGTAPMPTPTQAAASADLASCANGDVKLLRARGTDAEISSQVQGWSASLPGNGYAGIKAVFTQVYNPSAGSFQLGFPIVRLEGTSNDGVWSLHAGCGNRNGQATCDAICKSLSSPGLLDGWDVPCGTGYPAGSESVAASCIYKRGPADASASNWYDSAFGTTRDCANPMQHCECQGQLAVAPETTICTGTCSSNSGAGWSVGLPGNGFGGVSTVYSQAISQETSYFQLDWPIVRLEGTNRDGLWSLHAGCGNVNGRATCDAICKSLSSPGVRDGWDVPCEGAYGNYGYPGGAEVMAPQCTFKDGGPSSSTRNWYSVDFYETEFCVNPMSNCQCDGMLTSADPSSCGGACGNLAGTQYHAYIHYSGDWYPICGHSWWDNDHGANTLCQMLGFSSGTVARDSVTTLYRDAMQLGRCEAGEPLHSCTGGSNQFGLIPAAATCAPGSGSAGATRVTCHGPTSLSRQVSCLERPPTIIEASPVTTTGAIPQASPVTTTGAIPQAGQIITTAAAEQEEEGSSSTGFILGGISACGLILGGGFQVYTKRRQLRGMASKVLPVEYDDDVASEDSVVTAGSTSASAFPDHWTNKSAGFDQMVYVSTPMTSNFNEVMADSYVARATRDRGCPKAVDPCAPTPGGCPCVQPGGDPGLPTQLVVRRVVRVEDSRLWEKYVAKRQAIKSSRQHDSVRCFSPPLLTSAFADKYAEELGPLDKELNECFLFHGTAVRSALSIGQDNFKISLAGNNVGTMYGEGAYLAESCIKADEYTTDETGGYYDGVFAMLMFRVCMGKMFYTTQRDEEAGKNIMQRGTHDSTLGDRVASANTFREFVVYDDAQLYPEYIVFYSRVYAKDAADYVAELTRLQYQLQVPVYWKNCHKNPHEQTFDEQVTVRKEMVRVIQSLVSACTEGSRPIVHEVHRFEDSKMWMQYLAKKQQFSEELEAINWEETKVCKALKTLAEESMISTANLAEELNEFLLWHGTLKEYAEKISANGFIIGSARCGRRFGNGVYLAEVLDKSLSYCQADGDGFKYVLLCRAVCGKLYVTNASWESEADETAKGQGCNCVLAQPSGQAREFVVHEASQIYPEFVIKIRS